MSSPVIICHTETDTEWVDLLVEYLEASSRDSLSIRCSSLPGYGLNSPETDGDEFRSAITHADAVIAVVTKEALGDAQIMLEIGAAWALDRWMVLLLDPGLTLEELPKPLQNLTCLLMDGPQALIQLAQEVCVGYIVSDQSVDALYRMFGTYDVGVDISDREKVSPALPSSPTTKLPSQEIMDGVGYEEQVHSGSMGAVAESIHQDSSSPTSDMKRDYPSAMDSLSAGLAMSDSLFHRHESDSFIKELDGPFGTFVDALGGSWKDLRDLDDIDLFNGVTDNLISSLPPVRSEVSHWYDLGSHLSTMLNIAGQGLPAEPQQRETLQQKWQSSFNLFKSLAHEVEIQPQDILEIQQMLQNLIGPESEKDYTNIAKCLETLKHHASIADQ